MYGLAQMAQAPLLQPMNRCNPNPSTAPSTTERTVRTSNGVSSLSDVLEPGSAERIRRTHSEAPGSHEQRGFIMKVVIESIGKVGSRANVGGHELVFDQPSA